MKDSLLAVFAGLSCLAFAMPAPAAEYVPFTKEVRETYADRNCIPMSQRILLYPNRKLKKLLRISGDLHLFHTNQSVPHLFTGCTGPLDRADGCGVYNIERVRDETGEFVRCEFAARWRERYMMVVDVKLSQVGDDVYAQATATHYPYDASYAEVSATPCYEDRADEFESSYYESLDWNAASGMVRMSVHNLQLEFLPNDQAFTVTFLDGNGEVLDTQVLDGGDPAVTPEPPIVPGYLFRGWDKDVSSVKQDLTVQALYYRHCTVRFLNEDGSVYHTIPDVEEKTILPPEDLPEDPTSPGKFFIGWNPDQQTPILADENGIATLTPVFLP